MTGDNGKKPDPNRFSLDDIPHERTEPRPDFSKPLQRQKLKKDLQDEIDKADNDYWSQIYDGTASESTDSNVRYAAYATRVRTMMLSAQRYVAYTSDIGESFRPIAHPYLVKGAYAVSWLYLLGDVSYEGYKSYLRNQRVLHPEAYADEPVAGHSTAVSSQTVQKAIGQVKNTAQAVKEAVSSNSDPKDSSPAPGHVVPIEDYRAVMAQRAVFQGIASMGLPAFTIHSIVRYSGQAMKKVKNPMIRTWGPIGLGLAAVPALPYMFDKPVEEATEWVFHKAFQAVGGPSAVGHRPETGREDLLQVEAKKESRKEKEL